MSSVFLMPLTNIPQTFAISLGGTDYILTVKWNTSDDAGWVIDFTDAVTNLPIACNIPLITGADCLSGLEYLGINGELIVYTNGTPDAVPTLDNLGTDSNLYFVTDTTA